MVRSPNTQHTQEKTKTETHSGSQDVSNTRFKATSYDLNSSRCSGMPARDHLAGERVTRLKPVKLTRAKRISLPPYPNAKLSRNNRKEVDRPINEETIHYYCVQRRYGSKDRAKRRLRSVEANIVRSTCLVAGI